MTAVEVPEITIYLSLSPATYRFSDATAPQLTVTAVSDSDKPFTVFSCGTVLNPPTGLTRCRFTITDLTTGIDLPQMTISPQRPHPHDRVRGSSSEKYWLTIQPGAPVILSTGFGPDYAGPKAKAKCIWPDDKHGNRVVKVWGVDGLEPGHRYRLGIPMEEIRKRVWKWRWGTKEDFLVEPGHPDPWLHDGHFEAARMKFRQIKGVEFVVEEE
ncbi:MAG: hypothetical protein Q9202_006962 [Teloschistes flavicans]